MVRQEEQQEEEASMNEAADKAVIVLVGIGMLVPVFAFRVGRHGRAGWPKLEGLVPFVLALFAWLGLQSGTVPARMASLAVALSVPLVLYGWGGVRQAIEEAIQ